MDYGRLNRRELQTLCKQHGIPANKTNVFMAEALSALLNQPKDVNLNDHFPDPAEVVKSRATGPSGKNSEGADVLAPSDVDELSSHFDRSILICDLTAGAILPVVEGDTASEGTQNKVPAEATSHVLVKEMSLPEGATRDLPKVVKTRAARGSGKKTKRGNVVAPPKVDAVSSDAGSSTLSCDFDLATSSQVEQHTAVEVTEDEIPTNVASRQNYDRELIGETLRQSSRMHTEGMHAIGEEERMESTPEVLPTADSAPTVVEEAVRGSRAGTMLKASRVPKLNESSEAAAEGTTISDTGGIILEGLPEAAGMADISSDAPMRSELFLESRGQLHVSSPAKCRKPKHGAIVESHTTQEQMVEDVENGQGAEAPECVIPPQEVSPCLVVKIKSKGKRSKKLKKTLPASAPTLDEIVLPVMEEDASNGTINITPSLSVSDSPAFDVAVQQISVMEQSATQPTDTEEGTAFEFHPFPASLTEILSPVRPLRRESDDPVTVVIHSDELGITKECQHRGKSRAGKAGKICKSCESERKVATIMHEVLESMDTPHPQEAGGEFLSGTAVKELPQLCTPPVKQPDDKENTFKNLDLNSLSMRKLQKEVKLRGLSKRNNRPIKL